MRKIINKIIHWIIRKRTTVLSVSVEITDFEQMHLKERGRQEEFIKIMLAKKIADTLVENDLLEFSKVKQIVRLTTTISAKLIFIK